MRDLEARLAAAEAQLAQRNAELAVVGEIGVALAKQLEFDEIVELVGEHLRRLFNARSISIGLLEEGDQIVRWPYEVEEGRRIHSAPMAADTGLTRLVLQSRVPVNIGTIEESRARGAVFLGEVDHESFLGVPILAGEDVIGVIDLESLERNAFDDADVRLLSTLASAMGVALGNARLVVTQTKQEAEYRRVIEELPLAIYKDRPDTTSTSLYMSPKTEEIFGYPPERWTEEGFFDSVVHPDDRDRIASAINVHLETDVQKSTLTYRVIAADGRVVWVRDDAWLARDEAGNALYINGFMIDITDQVEAAAEIRRSKQYFEALVEISPVAIVTMDRGEIISGWNPAATRLFGYAPDEAIGRSINDLMFLPEERQEGLATTRLADETGRAQLIGRRRRKDGDAVDVEIAVVPLVVDGEHTGYYAIYHDITELQATRRAADAANEAKSAFLASMSHEIRTPMNAIIGMSGLLVDTELTDEQRDFAETIRTSGEALLTIINDILDFSKIEAGRLEIDLHGFDLQATIEGALDVIGPIAGAKGLELSYQVDPRLPRWFVGDGGRLRQIVLNLLSNAVKFTDTGEIVVSAGGEPVPGVSRDWNLSVEISDTGIGIPPDRMDRLFQSFSQADASIARRYGGTGLGLAISRRLAELMTGTLVARSTGVPGNGSTFTLSLRLPESEPSASATAAVPGSVDLAGRRVLVVDDNATNLRILVTQLERLGLVVTWTGSPIEARDLALRDQFDVLVTDLQMPDLDGIALAEAVRAGRPSGPPPVVILSSLGHREREAEAAVAWLSKPVKPTALREALERILGDGDGTRVGTEAPRFVADPGLGARHPLRVLLAEDNVVNQKLALRLLQGMGYQADVAGDGFKVLDALEHATYDVILMDVQMPELDGLETTRRIRGLSPRRSVRIVAMTANAMEGDREACLEAGMDDYLSKPIRPEQLAAALAATPRADARERLA